MSLPVKGTDRLAGRRKMPVKLLGVGEGVVEKHLRKAETERLARSAIRERDYVPIGLGRGVLAGGRREGAVAHSASRKFW